MSIGSFYNTKGVIVGQAAGFIGAEGTPMPADVDTVFDEATWSSTSIVLGTPSAGNWTLTASGGPLPAPSTTANIAFDDDADAVAAALQAVLPVGLTVVALGAGTPADPFRVAILGSGASKIIITGLGTGLTGGAFAVTPPAFTPLGATEQGWQANYGVTTQDITIEEQQTPVGRNVTAATYEFVANLSEDTVENLQYAMASKRTIQAPDSTHFGATQLNLTDELPVYAVVLETRNRFKLPRRYYVPSATCAVNVGQTFARARGQRLIPVTFSSICPVEDIVIRELTAVPT
jgi:hypothetical protein